MRIFEEKQWFDQWWLWALFLFCFGALFIRPVKLFLSGESFSLDTMEPGFWIGLTVMSLVIPVFRLLLLHTEIDDSGISYQFSPFHRSKKRIRWDEVKNCYTRKYQPILEYGGWGLRMGPKGSAYNVKGNFGVQIEFKNGEKLLIGTQNPERAQYIINKYFKNEGV